MAFWIPNLPYLKARNRDFEAKWGRDSGCTGCAIAKINAGITGLSENLGQNPQCNSVVFVSQNIQQQRELTLSLPSFPDEIDTLYLILSVPVSQYGCF